MEDAIETNDPIETTTKHALAYAKRRAATMLFANIETAAAKGIEDTSRLFDLATAFKNVSDSLPHEPESTVTNLQNELEAANDEVAQVRGELAAMTTSRTVLSSELSAVDVLLNYAKTWTTYTAPIVTHNQRKDVIKSLAERAEVLKGVQDELAKTELDKRMHPANAVGIIIEQRNEARVELAAISKQLPADAAKIVQERDALRAELATATNLAKLAKMAAEQRDAADAKLVAVMFAMVDQIDFWRRGSESFHWVAADLEKTLKRSLGDSYWGVLDVVLKARARAIPIDVALNDAAKDEEVLVDLASAPFPMKPTLLQPPVPGKGQF